MQEQKVDVNKCDIFDYVVGNSHYDPIEKCIDPTRYEVYDYFIYDNQERKRIHQEQDYVIFCYEVTKLKEKTSKMSRKEIESLCEELAEIAPTTIELIELI